MLATNLLKDINFEVIQGTEEEVTKENLLKHCDMTKIQSVSLIVQNEGIADSGKIYKLDANLEYEEAEMQIMTSIAMRGNL